MQTLDWYYNRLRSMSAGEIYWRLGALARDQFDRVLVPLKLYPSSSKTSRLAGDALTPGYSIISDISQSTRTESSELYQPTWRSELICQSDRLLEHKFSFFGLKDIYLGDPVDWHRDFNLDKPAPQRLSISIDYRDIQTSGDCKLVWEASRHYQVVVLARAWRISGDIKYAKEVRDQIESWIDNNPFGYGMNWRSPLELGIRLINWVWAYDLARDSGVFDKNFMEKFLHSIYLHLWDITKKYSQGSSANNHLVGEAAGVFIASSYFSQFPNAEKWRRESYQILDREIINQSFEDGCTREHALGYQYFVLQFYLFTAFTGEKTGNPFSRSYLQRLEKMFEFIGLMTEGGDEMPFFGDCDDGYVIDLGGSSRDFNNLLCLGAIFFNNAKLKNTAKGYHESAYWLFGADGHQKFLDLGIVEEKKVLSSHAFDPSGYYLLQHGQPDNDQAISVFVDCADLGYTSIAAHGNADALSFTLRAFGQDVFIDTGTYDYFTYPEWRNYFRSTRAHNTVMIDSCDQSVMQGPFLWGEKANCRVLDWRPDDQGGSIEAEHDGYRRLADPVMHKRGIALNGNARIVDISDVISASARHDVTLCFQISEHCQAELLNNNIVNITLGSRTLKLQLDTELDVTLLQGSTSPKAGWVSRGYHVKVPCSTVYAKASISGTTRFNSRIIL
ncbi:MAG TPA: heparinase [Gammaproteobacteria bacterium]|nr:heparinase [Gammaproteobacteria bacterium]